jgi:phosphoglycolate phosphatase
LYQLVGLDLDGTLVDSAPDLAHALGQALDAHGFRQPSLEQTRAWIGDGIEVLIARALKEAAGGDPDAATIRSALATFDQCYGREYFVRSRVYPGVLATLAQLRASGIKTVCITNKRIAFAEPLLAAAGLSSWLDFTYGGDSFKNRKPAPDQLNAAIDATGVVSEHAVHVGDSPNDLDAAQAAGWHFIYAGYGYTTAMRARGKPPTPEIGTFAELATLLQRQ